MRHGVPGLLCSIAFFAGTCMGLSFAADMDWLIDVALVVAVVLLLAAWVLRALALFALLLVVTATALLGLVSAGIETTTRPIDAPTGLVDAEPMLVRFEARLLDRFHAPDVARSDLLDRFQPDADQPPWNAPAELLAWHGDQGRVPVRGHVTISAATGPHALMAGDIVTGVGWLSGPAAPMNPGERDQRLSAWQRGWVGRLRVDGVPVCASHADLLQRSLDAARTFADQGLCASLQGWCDDETRALVVAMTTGRRLPGYAALRQQFAATGLSHFLAISGFNVAVLFVTCGVLMELLCIPGHWRGWMLMLLATLFLLVVDVEVSVLRAGMAGLLAGASIALGRGWRSNGLLATAAIVTLVADPRMAWNTWFQLSYLAVLALRFGSTPIERLLCMPARHVAWPRSERLRSLVRAACTAFAASAAASIASTPVTLAWFGSLNPWCAVASTLLGPLAAALTVVATIAVVLGQLPVIGPMIGCALALLAGCFRLGVNWVGTWPMCSMAVTPLPWWWGVIALMATFAMFQPS